MEYQGASFIPILDVNFFSPWLYTDPINPKVEVIPGNTELMVIGLPT